MTTAQPEWDSTLQNFEESWSYQKLGISDVCSAVEESERVDFCSQDDGDDVDSFSRRRIYGCQRRWTDGNNSILLKKSLKL